MHGSCSSTLKRTVLDKGRHCPMVTMSPSFTFCQHGEQCTVMFLWRFSNLKTTTEHTRKNVGGGTMWGTAAPKFYATVAQNKEWKLIVTAASAESAYHTYWHPLYYCRQSFPSHNALKHQLSLLATTAQSTHWPNRTRSKPYHKTKHRS